MTKKPEAPVASDKTGQVDRRVYKIEEAAQLLGSLAVPPTS